MTNTDWLGSSYDVGDPIIYAAQSGGSVTMILARVIKFNESGSVQVQPLGSSRWEQHSKRRRWIDSRTGKGIYPHTGEHVKERDYQTCKITGDRLDPYGYGKCCPEVRPVPRSWQPNRPEGHYHGHGEYDYHPTVFHDYVQEVTEPAKPVTLTVTKNITRWFGPIPEVA